MKRDQLRLLLSYSSSRKLFPVSGVASCIWAAIVVGNALLLSKIIVSLISRSAGVEKLIFWLASLWLIRILFQPSFEYWTSSVAVKFKANIRSEISHDREILAQYPPSQISALLIKGLNSLDIYIGRFIPQMIFAVATPIAVIATIFTLDKLSAVIALITLPLIPFFGAFIGKYTNDSVSRKWQSLGTLSSYFEDSLKGFITLRIFGRHKSQPDRIAEMGDRYTEETMKVLRISFLSAFALELCATISVALIAVAIGLRLVDNQITFSAALATLILAPEVYFPLRSAASLFHASVDGSEALSQLKAMKDKSENSAAKDEKEFDFSKSKEIAWNTWLLEIPEVTPARIPAGKLGSGTALFLQGDSGLGKTTFLKNFLGYANECEVRVDGVLLTSDLKKSWQREIGWIAQTPHLAPGSVRSQFQCSDAEIIELLKTVSLDIASLPQGIDTPIGFGGEKSDALSGGQLRKLSVARALVRKPRFIFADEPTSDLDSESAAAVMSALRSAVKNGAGLLCVTHSDEFLEATDQRIHVVRLRS